MLVLASEMPITWKEVEYRMSSLLMQVCAKFLGIILEIPGKGNLKGETWVWQVLGWHLSCPLPTKMVGSWPVSSQGNIRVASSPHLPYLTFPKHKWLVNGFQVKCGLGPIRHPSADLAWATTRGAQRRGDLVFPEAASAKQLDYVTSAIILFPKTKIVPPVVSCTQVIWIQFWWKNSKRFFIKDIKHTIFF